MPHGGQRLVAVMFTILPASVGFDCQGARRDADARSGARAHARREWRAATRGGSGAPGGVDSLEPEARQVGERHYPQA